MKQFRTFLAAFLIKDILNFSQGCILWLYMYANGAGLFFICFTYSAKLTHSRATFPHILYCSTKENCLGSYMYLNFLY